MKKEIYTCDGCGKQKDKSNHWFGANCFSDTLIVVSFTESLKRGGLWEHFCGEECLMRMVARNLPK